MELAIEAKQVSLAVIGPSAERRSSVLSALAASGRTNVREFDSYPPALDHLNGLLNSFDAVLLDADSDPGTALSLLERASAAGAAAVMAYSEKADQNTAVLFMRGGAREFLLLPIEQEILNKALDQIKPHSEKSFPIPSAQGNLLVCVGSKGGSGVTTVACHLAIALADKPGRGTLLIDLALPIGDAAMFLGLAADHSTADALRNIDVLDAGFLRDLVGQHKSGAFVLAAPSEISDAEFSRDAIETLIALARREFDYVVVDVGSRIDVAGKALFQEASATYLVTQTGASELRNANRLIAQFLSEGSSNLEVIVNRIDFRSQAEGTEDAVAKALGRPARWKIHNDQNATQGPQFGKAGISETEISRITQEIAGSISGRSLSQNKKKGFDLIRGSGRGAGMIDANDDPPLMTIVAPPESHTTPAVSWPVPMPIDYGDKLTGAHLNATASVAGNFVYTPGLGYVLPVGTHSLWVTFTPANSDGSEIVQSAVTIAVNKATPTLLWPTPAEIAYGAPLNEAQLNASASIPGEFEYSPARGEVLLPGRHTLSVRLMPRDNANYLPAEAKVELSVAKARPALHWPAPNFITYGMLLSSKQLCASAQIPGTFEFLPGLGSLLAAGEHQLMVLFTPANDSEFAVTQTFVSLTVSKAKPTVSWPAPGPIFHGVPLSSAHLNASSNVPGHFSYSASLGEVLPPGVHTLSATFNPTDELNFTAVEAEVQLTVAEVPPTLITWLAPSPIPYGEPLSAMQLNAEASVPGTFTYTPAAGHILAPGTYKLSASFVPSDTENCATAHAEVVLEVEKLTDKTLLPNTANRSFSKTQSTVREIPAEFVPAEVHAGQAEPERIPRETRTYKGAVYEKGDDGQWHLQSR
jgi:Flp pilus assembly CpaE family ATPase